MRLNIQRKTLDGRETFSFQFPSSNYIVKNFGSGDIYVAFEPDATTDESIKIATGAGQMCSINCPPGNNGAVSDKVYITGSGEVEVQQV